MNNINSDVQLIIFKKIREMSRDVISLNVDERPIRDYPFQIRGMAISNSPLTSGKKLW